MVCQAIEQRAGEPLRAEDARPVLERQVRGDDRRSTLVSLGEDLEQKLGTRRRQRNVAEFVDDQELDGLEVALQLQKTSLVAGFHELVDEGGGGREGDGEALLAGGQPESQRHMRLSGARVAKCDDVLPAQDKLAAGKFQHQHLVEAGDRREVEGVEAFDRREPRRLDPPFDHAPFPVDQLELDEAKQIAGMIDAVAGAFPSHLVVFPEHRRQLQLLEVVSEQNLRRVAGRSRRHLPGSRFAVHAALPGMRTA